MPIILILISVGLFYLHISPRYHEVQNLQDQQKQYKDALARASELGSVRDTLLTKYNSFSQSDLARLERIVPEKVNTVKLIADTDSIAGRYGITIKSITASEQPVDNNQSVVTSATPAKAYKTTVITFKFSATYPNFVLFLKDLEKSLQLIDVEKVTFDVPSDASSKGLYDYTASIDTYSLN